MCKLCDYLEERDTGKEKGNCKCPEPGACLQSSVKSKAGNQPVRLKQREWEPSMR